MRQVLVVATFMLATMGWGVAQMRPMGPQSGPQQPAQPTAPPDASQSQPGMPGAGQAAPDASTQTQVANKPVTEGCLGGSNPNFTITDKAGTKYNLVLPPNANGASLNPHVGESVQVMGDVTNGSSGNAGSINVMKVGRGQGSCSK